MTMLGKVAGFLSSSKGWETLSHAATTLGGIGLFFGVLQYYDGLEANRASETLQLSDLWETRGYREDFGVLRDDVIRLTNAVPQEDLAQADSNQHASDNLRRRIATAVLAIDGNSDRFERIVYFFNRLGLCVEARLCSSETANLFFNDPISGFASYFEPEIVATRQQMPGYAEGLCLLSARCLGD